MRRRGEFFAEVRRRAPALFPPVLAAPFPPVLAAPFPPVLAALGLVLAALATAGCMAEVDDPDDGVDAAAMAIVGGKPARTSDAGPTVAIVDDAIGPICTGVLILSDRVVTAAHCVDDARPEWITVVTGDDDVGDEVPRGTVHGVREILIYPHYRRDFVGTDPDGLDERHDLAMLQLDGHIYDVDNALILPERHVDTVLQPGAGLIVAGFGAREEGGPRGALSMAVTPFWRRRGGELLAGGEGHPDTCHGDSGGPAFFEVEGHRHLVGITSRAAGEGCGAGGIYTLAPQYE
ncbi:MAG: trypsin-like serine protease [Myxococcota bacterium]